MHCKAYKLEPVREFLFHPTRKWRADFAFPEKMLLVEIDGGTRMNGRHNRHDGYTEDARKINEAVLMGFRVLRFTSEMVHSGEAIDAILKALGRNVVA